MSYFEELLIRLDANVVFPLRVWYTRNRDSIRTTTLITSICVIAAGSVGLYRHYTSTR